MNKEKLPPLYSIEMIFLSFFGTGFSPYAPGTVGSLATLPFLYWFAWSEMPTVFITPLLIFLIAGSGFLIEMFQRRYELKDPGWIVIDEVIGMLAGFMIWPSGQWYDLALLFVLFRVFDITKIWPVSYFDKDISHGIGVVLDDVMAGIYAGGILWVGHNYIFPNFI